MNVKSEKGAVTLVVLVTMLFLVSFLMSMYIRISNKAQSSAEATAEIAAKYARAGQDIIVAGEYQVIPIKTVEDLKLMCSGQTKMIDGEVYKFSADAYYAIQNDLDLECDEDNQWVPLPIYEDDEFTGVLDGLGHKITGLYIDGEDDYQGFFGTLTGTVKNIIIEQGHVKGNNYVGSIAALNNGTIINCKNTAEIIGNNYVAGGYFTSITTNQIIDVWRLDTVLSENVRFISESDVAVVPKGFKVSAKTNEQTISDGLVIQDSDGNEFVWVPVNYTATGNIDSNGLDSGFLAVFYRSKWSNNARTTGLESNYKEDLSNDPTGKYNEMMLSVQENNGFYIGRFEAGIPTNENPRTTNTENIGTNTMVVKQDCYPYNNVGWGASMTDYTSDIIITSGDNTYSIGKGAVYLSRNMYTGNNFGVTSTLCYSVQWDAVLDFIKDIDHDVCDGNLWGNHSNSVWTIDRKTAKYSENSGQTWKKILDEQNGQKSKNSSTRILLTTGADEKFKVKNIYDLAGNVSEWTMETRYTDRCIIRGGSYSLTGGGIMPSGRNNGQGATDSHNSIGFRVTLYL